jgi:hypothetical protein
MASNITRTFAAIRPGVIREDDGVGDWWAEVNRQARDAARTLLPDAEPARYPTCGCLVTDHHPDQVCDGILGLGRMPPAAGFSEWLRVAVQQADEIDRAIADGEARARATLQVSAATGLRQAQTGGPVAERQTTASDRGIDGAFNAACVRIKELEADLAISRARSAQLSAHIQRWQAENASLRAAHADLEAKCTAPAAALPDITPPASDTSAEAVQRRVDGAIDDLVAGRTTSAQRRGLGSAVQRADRVQPGADAAVGRALGQKPTVGLVVGRFE